MADKAYALERHVIVPYKEPAARLAANAAFNYELSVPRVKIEHAFGVLKARWPTLYEIPVRIDSNKEQGHLRVHNWTMACVVLHNFLKSIQDDEGWLEVEIEQGNQQGNNAVGSIRDAESNTEAKRAGVRRWDELRDLVGLLRV